MDEPMTTVWLEATTSVPQPRDIDAKGRAATNTCEYEVFDASTTEGALHARILPQTRILLLATQKSRLRNKLVSIAFQSPIKVV